MPTVSRTAHKTVDDTALPYVTNSSVISTDPQYIAGQNVMTSLRQWVERRPGFSLSVEAVPTAFSNLQRQVVWRRWTGSSPNGGQFVWMGCDVSLGQARVYKMILGVDVQAQLIWTSASAEPFDFVVSNNTCFFGNGTDMKAFDSVTVRNWGIVSPAAGPGITLVAGANNVYVSWCYLYTYYNVNTDHESSPSPISACSGGFSAKTVNLAVTASTDPQVTNIRVYRTTDGGAQDPTQMREISGSPFANATATVSDTTLDANLSATRVAPAFFRNDPPTPGKGFVAYGGRIWGFLNNATFYSGSEEIANGVPEECWPSGLDGNNYLWDNEVTSHAPLLDGVAIYTAERVYKVEGDSLDTFRRYTLLEKRGARARTAVAALGGSVAWFDTSRTMWISDMGEIGVDIRPDLQQIDPTNAWVAIHIAGLFHWVTLLDGATGNLFVYDIDRKRWMPPWDTGTTGSALASYETSPGVFDLMLARNQTKSLKLASGTYNDDGNTYPAFVQTNMYRLTPDANPGWKGVLDWIELKTDTGTADDVLQLTDDDPSVVPFTSIVANAEDSPDIIQGQALKTNRYPSAFPQAQMLALQVRWNAAESNFHLYQTDVALHPSGE